MTSRNPLAKIAVVIPCYKVANHIVKLIETIPSCVDAVYCVNDACPDHSTDSIDSGFHNDDRIMVIKRVENGGVGAAMVTGYKQAVEDGADVVVKLDGDGQMDPRLIPLFVREIVEGRADYVKGNRFYSLSQAKSMPLIRKIGNMGLSFLTKLSTGYWQLFDPTNGYTAIHANLLRSLPLDDVEGRYFFESDMLFHLGLLRAKVTEVPMVALYSDEESSLSVGSTLLSFPAKHARNFFKRIFYDYYLRNFSLASLELLVGFMLIIFGVSVGISEWINTARTGQMATAGTVMLASLPTILGVQFILNFFGYDMAHEPNQVVHDKLRFYLK